MIVHAFYTPKSYYVMALDVRLSVFQSVHKTQLLLHRPKEFV